jgi:hypothetical protein
MCPTLEPTARAASILIWHLVGVRDSPDSLVGHELLNAEKSLLVDALVVRSEVVHDIGLCAMLGHKSLARGVRPHKFPHIVERNSYSLQGDIHSV